MLSYRKFRRKDRGDVSCSRISFLLIAAFSLLPTASAVFHEIHKRMTTEHLREIFYVDHAHQVPNYVVAPVHIDHHDFHRFKRSIPDPDMPAPTNTTFDTPVNIIQLQNSLKMILEAFNEKFHLNLKKALQLPASRPPKVFYADMINGAPVLQDATPELSLASLQDALYQDIDNMAALSIRTSKDKNDLLLDGVLGDEYIIKSIPKELKFVIAVDTADGAFIGDDPDDRQSASTSTPSTTLHTYVPLNMTKHTGISGAELNQSSASSPEAMQMNDAGLDSFTTHYHIVYRRAAKEKTGHGDTVMSEDGFLMSESEEHPISDYALLSDSLFVELPSDPNSPVSAGQSSAKSLHRQRSKRAPFGAMTVWPEVLVLVDYATFNLHGGNEKRITSYFATFWNAVDLRYRQLSAPEIHLQLSGIIISRNPGFMPYIEENRMPSPDDDSFDSKQALSDMAKYLFQQQDMLPKFDLAMVITKLDMCRRKDDEGPCVRGTAGFAYVGGACHVDESRGKLNKAGIVEDSGGFSGVIVAAHEVGHLLGCVHDGTAAPSYLGGPGAETCSWYDGYIMSDLRHNVNGFKWSTCSMNQFKHFLSRPQAACLFDAPMPGLRLGSSMPGKIIPLDWQCRLDRGTTACFKDARVCTQLYCHDKDTGYCIAFRPAAEGSPCGTGKNCRDGVCITDADAAGGSSAGSDFAALTGPAPALPAVPPLPTGEPPAVALPGSQSIEREDVCEGDVPGVRVSGMPCKEFLRVTGTTYCDHRDIVRYCCNARRIFCPRLRE